MTNTVGLLLEQNQVSQGRTGRKQSSCVHLLSLILLGSLLCPKSLNSTESHQSQSRHRGQSQGMGQFKA